MTHSHETLLDTPRCDHTERSMYLQYTHFAAQKAAKSSLEFSLFPLFSLFFHDKENARTCKCVRTLSICT